MAVRPLPWATLTIPSANRVNATATPADARQLSAAGSRSIVPLTYGQDRVGGLLLNVLPATTGSTTILVQVLWGFAGTAVGTVQLNGQALPGAATVTTYLGTQSTADASLVTAFAAQSITYVDTLAGFAYSVIAIPQASIGTELQFTALFSGRAVYDPRKDTTVGGSGAHRLATPSTWEFSDCPALALADFLYSATYGASETVDWASVATTANANDALVGSPTEKRRLVGVTFTSVSSVADVAETLRAYAGCFILPSASGIKLLPDADDSPVATYTHVSGAIASISGLQLRDLGNSPTSVEIIYTDTTVIPWRDASAFADLPGSGTTLPYRLSTVRMPGVHRYSQANREAIERLNKLTLQDLSTTIEVFDIGIRHQRGDIITLTHPIGVTNKLFRITDVEAPAPGRWVLPLIEHDPACYSTVVATVPIYSNSGALISEAGGGGSGISSYMIEIYTQADTQPPTPSGGQYTFVDDVFVEPSVDWSRDQPEGSTVSTWVSRYLVQTTTPEVTIEIPSGLGAGNILDALLTSGPEDTVLPVVPSGSIDVSSVPPSYSAAGMESDFDGGSAKNIAYSSSVEKLQASKASYAGFEINYSVQVVFDNTTNASTDPAYFFYIYVFGGRRQGFMIAAGERLRAIGIAGEFDSVDIGAVPVAATFELRYAANSGLLQYIMNGAVVHTATYDQRLTCGVAVGITGVCSRPKAWFKNLKMHVGSRPYLGWSVPNKHVQDGEGGAVLSLMANSQVFKFTAAGAPTPTLQTITFTANVSSLVGSPTFAGVLYDAAGASLGAATLGGAGTTRTLTVANFGAAQYCVVTVTLATYTDAMTVVRLQDGSGNVVGLLTNESVTIAADAAGVVASFAGTGGTFLVFDGLVSKTGDVSVTYSVVGSPVGVSISIASTGVYTITAMSADTGTATLRAVYGSVTVDKVYSISKAKAGVDGAAGTSVFTGTIFRQQTGTPSAPSGGTFNFTSSVLTPPAGWTVARPAPGLTETFSSTFTFSTTTPGATVTAGTWSAPVSVAAGTAGPVTSPGNFFAASVSTPPSDATASVEFRRNGAIWHYQEGTSAQVGSYYLANDTEVGDAYDVRADLTFSAGSAGGLSGATVGEWLQINADRKYTLTTTEDATTTRDRTFSYTIRDRTSLATVSSGQFTLDAVVEA